MSPQLVVIQPELSASRNYDQSQINASAELAFRIDAVLLKSPDILTETEIARALNIPDVLKVRRILNTGHNIQRYEYIKSPCVGWMMTENVRLNFRAYARALGKISQEVTRMAIQNDLRGEDNVN